MSYTKQLWIRRLCLTPKLYFKDFYGQTLAQIKFLLSVDFTSLIVESCEAFERANKVGGSLRFATRGQVGHCLSCGCYCLP